jgi:hypothetical protein
LGDQATIKAAWLRVANATGAKKASAAAMQKNLDLCGSLVGVAVRLTL